MAKNTDQVHFKTQEQIKKDHPDWCVNGVYYDDETEYNEAKSAYEEKIRVAQESAASTAQKKAEELAKVTYEINNALYGENAGSTLAQMEESVGGVEIQAILGNAEDIIKRQHLVDYTQYQEEFKKPNNGKPPNNSDPFPVDLKIEELEAHKPDVKIHQVTTHVHGEPAAKAAMLCSDTAEKRLIHIENNMATMMRYLFRLGARVSINCVYWGGKNIA